MPDFPSSDLIIGRCLGGQVEVRSPLGVGGMGRVYLGWHRELKTQVAVKLLPRGAEASLFGRLKAEMTAARRLDHPNAVKVLDSGVDPSDGAFYVVMELVEGKDLAHLIKGGERLPVPRACSIMDEVLSALAEAHRLNILHRDIKPGNIMITRVKSAGGAYRDAVKVVDFGLAKMGGDQTSLTASGMAAGTPGFMAPEQALGEKLDGRADVYSCGVTLYRLVAGRMPFAGDRLAQIVRALNERAPAIDGIDPELDRVIHWAMERDPARRCPSAEAFREALAPFAEGAAPRSDRLTLPAPPAPPSPDGRAAPGDEKASTAADTPSARARQESLRAPPGPLLPSPARRQAAPRSPLVAAVDRWAPLGVAFVLGAVTHAVCADTSSHPSDDEIVPMVAGATVLEDEADALLRSGAGPWTGDAASAERVIVDTTRFISQFASHPRLNEARVLRAEANLRLSRFQNAQLDAAEALSSLPADSPLRDRAEKVLTVVRRTLEGPKTPTYRR